MFLLRHALGRVRRQGSLAGDIARHCRPRRPHLDLRLFPKMININSLRQWHCERRNRDRICAGAAKGRVTLDRVHRTDYDRVEGVGHRSTRMTRVAPAIATVSSMSAAGQSRIKLAARRPRTAAPPRVPNTAPTAPRASPTRADPPARPNAAPATAPIRTRVPNWTGTLRLGVDGS